MTQASCRDRDCGRRRQDENPKRSGHECCGASSKADENGTHEYSEVRIVSDLFCTDEKSALGSRFNAKNFEL